MFFEKPKPVKKSGVKKLDKKVNRALNASGGKCVECKKNKRVGDALFCRSCLKVKPKKKGRGKKAVNSAKKTYKGAKKAKGAIEKKASKIWGY